MAAAHSILGASASHRWLECPGSVKLSEGIEPTRSVYADEGTAAHILAEHCLSRRTNTRWLVGQQVRLSPAEVLPEGEDGDFEIDDEMAEAVQVYLEACRAEIRKGDDVQIEHRFDLSHLHPLFFGTADFTRYRPETRELVVLDYKHGQGVPVEVKDNPQALYYAVGAAHAKQNRGLESVRLGIVQPRCAHRDGPVRWWTVDPVDLLEWQADLVEGARRTEQPDAPLVPGDHCRFCPAAGICPALRSAAYDAARADFADDGEVVLSDPTTFDDAALGLALRNADKIEMWLKRLREHAHAEAMHGRIPAGWKIVQKRATRKWKSDEDAIASLQTYGLDEADLYAKKLRSPAQIEKVVGKENNDVLTDLVESVSSGTVLAPESDKRPAVTVDAASEFMD